MLYTILLRDGGTDSSVVTFHVLLFYRLGKHTNIYSMLKPQQWQSGTEKNQFHYKLGPYQFYLDF